MANTRIDIDRFDGTGDFMLWKVRMLAHFGILGLKEIIRDDKLLMESDGTGDSLIREGDSSTGVFIQKSVSKDPIKVEKSEKAMNLIITNVGDVVLRIICGCTTAAEMWSLLERTYMSTTLPNRIFLQLKFYTFKMVESKSIDANINDFLKIVSDLNSAGVVVSNEVQAILLLSAMPARYDQLKETLKYARDSITVEEVIGAAKAKERELKESGQLEKDFGEGLILRDKDEYQNRRNFKRDTSRGRPVYRNDFRKQDRSRSNSKSRMVCWYCRKEGHIRRNCFARKKDEEKGGQGEAAVLTDRLQYSNALTVTDLNPKDNWVIDSGCSYHMTSRRDWFHTYEEINASQILLGNDNTVEAKGIGSVKISSNGGSVKVLNNVRYVPNLRRNLMSTGTLDKLGFNHRGGNGKIVFDKDGRVALQGELKYGLYIFDGNTVIPEVCQVEAKKELSGMWHNRMGHTSEKNLQILVSKGLVKKNEVTPLNFCEHCIMGKTKRVSFTVGKHDTGMVLGYVHADLWGSPNITPSMSDYKYFLSIIDDYSRKVWLYFLKRKDEAFKSFCEWKTLVENQVCRKVKCLRTDNGLEFCNVEFNEFCKKNGIERHKTCTYTPQQNGVAERMNRTIMEKVRCMLNHSGLDESFWAEAAATAVYLINRTPSSAIDNSVPEQIWLDKKPGYRHLRTFGSVVYVHIDQGKLKPRALKGIFIGYPKGTKGYRVWLLDQEKCIISRNVIFQEHVMYKDVKDKSEVTVLDDSDEKKMKSSKGKEKVISIVTNTIERDSNADLSISGGVMENSETEVNEDDESDRDVEIDQGLSDYQLARDRSRRINIARPARFSDEAEIAFALTAADIIEIQEPMNVDEAKSRKDWRKWKSAMDEEMLSLNKNQTWSLVDKPEDKKVIGCRWIFKIKPGIPGGEHERYKARLVAKGYAQREGVDYQEVFAPVVKHISIRIMLSLVVQGDLELEQMDVKTAFLHGSLEEEIFMSQPECFEKGSEDKVCLLKKSLYGLKQSPRQWNKRFDGFMIDQGYTRSEYDHCVYVKRSSADGLIYLLLYVDDILIAAKNPKEIKELKNLLSLEFEMKDLGNAKRILGMDILRNRDIGSLRLSQSSYLEKVLKNFNMSESVKSNTPVGAHFKLKTVSEEDECVDSEDTPYSSAVGSVMYAMVGSRPDLAYGIGVVSRFMSNPGKMHWEAVKWLLRYIKGAKDLSLEYTKEKEFTVQGFCDSDYATDLDRRRSITGFVFQVGGNTISWKSGLQTVVALSTTEAEYMALTEAIKEAIWIKGLLKDLGFEQKSVVVWCDSQSAICLAKNSVYHERTKHIDVRLHFIREQIASGEIEVLKIPTLRNPADVLTKVVPVEKFNNALALLKITKA